MVETPPPRCDEKIAIIVIETVIESEIGIVTMSVDRIVIGIAKETVKVVDVIDHAVAVPVVHADRSVHDLQRRVAHLLVLLAHMDNVVVLVRATRPNGRTAEASDSIHHLAKMRFLNLIWAQIS